MEEKYKFKNREEYIKALDSTLPDKFIKERDIGKKEKHRYIPSAIQQAVADDLFHYWNVTKEDYNNIVNELICTVSLTYVPGYPGATELYCTGSASKPIQMKSNSKATDFPANKIINALEYGLPSARSVAINNAFGTIGNIFGRNLARKLNKDENVPDDFTIRKHAKDKSVSVKKENKKPEPENKPKIDTPF